MKGRDFVTVEKWVRNKLKKRNLAGNKFESCNFCN